jgi:alkylresorcinol/alkylpyrone synthase
MRIAAVGKALPAHYYDQERLLEAFRRIWAGRVKSPRRFEDLHRNVQVRGRHLALPMAEYEAIRGFGDANAAFVRCATELGEAAARDALARAGLAPSDVRHLVFATVTGLSVPSIDARLVNRMGLRTDVKRTPIFGLGCVAGAAGIARVADALRGAPDDVALFVSVELCSLTLQREDFSVANAIASGLFGDGAAAVVMTGANVHAEGPRVVASGSVFFPDTEDAMGWTISERGFQIVLSGEVPRLALGIRKHVDELLASQDMRLADVDHFVCHPGGPKVLEAFERALDLPDDALDLTWEHLREVGNLSSASVLHVLRDTLDRRRPEPGSHGLVIAMGPGFCAELVLLRW